VINNRDENILKAFGNRLRELRLRKGYSQHKLSLIADISKNQIGNIERGEVNVTLIAASAIDKALEVSLRDLYEFPI